MSSIVVKHSRDALKAFIAVTQSDNEPYPAKAQLLKALSDHGITHGIDNTALEKIASEKIVHKFIPVASGTPAGSPVHGRLEPLIDISQMGKPKQLSNGRVDHRNLQKVLNVKQGTVLLRRIPPKLGKDGTDVFGNRIKASKPRDVALPSGIGVEVSPKDENTLIAATDGYVYEYEPNCFEVRKEKKIVSDIDYSTGNIDFYGDLRIDGVIRSGFEVKATGDIIINGSLEDAIVKADGNVAITGGASGAQSGKIESHADTTLKYCEQFSIQSVRDITIEKDSVHSQCYAGGTITAQNIVGGFCSARAGIVAHTIGNDSEVRTTVHIGISRELENKRYALLKKLTKVNTEDARCREEIFNLVNNNVSSEGTLNNENCEKLRDLKEQRKKLLDEEQQLQDAISELQEKTNLKTPAFIKASSIYPNTTIQWGEHEQKVNRLMRKVYLTIENGKLHKENL